MSKRKVKPLSPDEAADKAQSEMPDFVIEAVNNLLQKELHQGYATLRQEDVMKEIMRLAPEGTKRQDVFDNKWLDFEPIFEKAGWSVEYDKPGYNESYEPTFDFKDKRKRGSLYG
jgi:hypothetical protein